MEVIIEGKVKTVYAGDDADRVIIEYHDKVTAGNGEKEDHPLGKGSLCCSISSIIFEKLAKENIPTHYINMVGANKMVCKKVEIVPLEVICRNRAAGSIVRETTLVEGSPLPQPIVEFFLKDDSKHDPLLTPDRVRLMGYNPEPFIEMTLRLMIISGRCFISWVLIWLTSRLSMVMMLTVICILPMRSVLIV